MKNAPSHFHLIESRYVPEEQSTVHLLEHAVTGSPVLYIENSDPNKVFTIAFRTPPLGSTGNCHILEHAVLNGSRKYCTKEPFMDLLKSSLQTFLNAITYPDKTVYPVASRNDADFANLMDLYLDAVFNPRVLEDELIFRQEGWRYEIFDKADPIVYQGVVYNEMKGALSSAENQVIEQINQALYEGTVYGENSGGDPYVIPTLDYDAFRHFHRTYYHPSNAYTVLYGAINETEAFTRLNEYFSAYSRAEIDSLPPRVTRLSSPVHRTMSFSVSKSEPTAGAAFLSCSWLLGDNTTSEQQYISHLIATILIEAEASPLRNALLKELTLEDLFTVTNAVRENSLSIVAKNIDPAQRPRFEAIIERYLRQFAEDGIDRELIEGVLNNAEFHLREKGNYATKGIVLSLSALGQWLYGFNPIDAISYRDNMAKLHAGLDAKLFERFIREHLLDNPHRIVIEHLPEPGLNERRDADVAKKLSAFKATLSDDALDALIAQNEALRTRQDTPDSEADKATIPTLTRAELPTALVRVPREIHRDAQATWLLHDLPTSGIHYVDLLFDVNHIAPEDAPYLATICELIGLMDTAQHDFRSYANRELLCTGGITATPKLYAIEDSDDRFERKLIVSTKFLGLDHLEEGLSLIDEQLLHTSFADRDRLLDLLKMVQSQYQSDLVQNAHRIMRDRAMSHISRISSFHQQLNGLSYYSFVRDFVSDFTEAKCARLERIYSRLFRHPSRIVNLTAERDHFDRLRSSITAHLAAYPTEALAPADVPFEPKLIREAFYTSVDVQYVAIAAPLKTDEPLRDDLIVLSKLLSNEYLYNEIRAKGGAYGAGMIASASQRAFSTYSYRDPNLSRTLEIYRRLGDQIAALDLTEADLERFIIGAVGAVDEPMTEHQKGLFDLAGFIMQRESTYYDDRLREIVSATVDGLRRYADAFKAALPDACVAVLGSEQQIREACADFDEVVRL